ncbi:MAG TPA: hypothetical protein VM580_05350, partial [Labilithrix sp.]|nr:hypothetical protein [Labilithrix sp.]
MDIETLEQLAFGDRTAALAAMLPGTGSHDYWRGVLLQHEGRLDEVDEILSSWAERHGKSENEWRDRLRRRQLLLRADADLPGAADELRREAGVVLNDRAEVVAQAQRHPTKLDPALIDGEKLLSLEIGRRADLSTVSDFSLPEVLGRLEKGDVARRRSLLQRLTRANIPGLVDAIADDLDDRTSSGFGSLPVHSQLTLAQLEELAGKRSELRAQSAWVKACLTRLCPPSWVDLRVDIAAREALLDRVGSFVASLGHGFNSLKAQVLYRRLELDRTRGRYDRARFLSYLELPRNAHYVARDWLGRVPAQHLAEPGDPMVRAIGMEPVHDDEPLVRDYLRHFLRAEDGSAFTTWLRAEFVEEELAITRLLGGATGADVERWGKVLGAARLSELRDRVEIDLAGENRVAYRANDTVALEVDVKNVRDLEVKIFRINTLAYFLARGADVDTSIDLDGMIASERLEVHFDAPPLCRTRTRIELSACQRPGTYVVELIGNGRSSRALIRKGSLRHSVRVGAAGLVVTIMNEDGVPLRDARLWLGGREFVPRNEDDGADVRAGEITIPFSTRPGLVPILLAHGDVTQRETIHLPAEDVRLGIGLHLERESLVPNQAARLLCRASLTIGGGPASLALLEDVRAEVSVTDVAGTSSSRTQPLSLRDDAESVIEIHVPEGVTYLSVRVRGRVRVISTQQTIEVEGGASAAVNVIHTTEQTADLHLVKHATTEAAQGQASYEVHVLGKTGEALPGRAVFFRLYHRNVCSPVTTTLETNERGVIELGLLDGIERITAKVSSGRERSWSLPSTVDVPKAVHALEDGDVVLPVPDGTRLEELSVIELRGGVPAHDATARVALNGRCAVVRLAPGEYRFSAGRTPSTCTIQVAPRAGGAARSGWAVSGQAMFELTPPLPLIRSFVREGDHVVLRLSGATAETRLHLIATCFFKDSALPSSLQYAPHAPLSTRLEPAFSSYVSGRDIGDEYRYVLERRGARRRPGTMLEKPSLLLHPWALRTTTTGVQVAAPGAAYAAAPPPPPAGAPAPARHVMAQARAEPHAEEPGFSSVDFLARGAILIDNLRPDADGVVRVPIEELGGHTGAAQLVQAILVDPLLTSTCELALSKRTAALRDSRLRVALDPARHFAEDRSV